MLQAKPGCYVWLGAGRGPDTPNVHNPHYDFNDDALPIGASYWVTLVGAAARGVKGGAAHAGRAAAAGAVCARDRAAGDRVIASRDDLEAALDSMARDHRMVFFAGLPGVGKSLYIRELARVAHAHGAHACTRCNGTSRGRRSCRPSILARYPDRDGIAHPMVRKGVGQWVRQAVLRWHRDACGDRRAC